MAGLVPAATFFFHRHGVDARDKCGHDEKCRYSCGNKWK